MIRILFICHGNICRSPMAEFAMKDLVEKRGLRERVVIESAATSTEEIWNGRGNPVYPPAQAELRKHGIGGTSYTDFSSKRAVQITRRDYDGYDMIICMDDKNKRNTLRITGGDPDGKVSLLMDYTDRRGAQVADPWYTGNFIETWNDVSEGCEGLLQWLAAKDLI